MLTVVFLISVLTIIYYFIKTRYEYWEKRGVTGPKPYPLVGNIGKVLLLQCQPGKVYDEAYKKYDKVQVVGLYRALTPVLLIRDPELIKEVTIKSFHHFRDNDIDVDQKVDPIFGRNPFVLKGDQWKTVRTQLTPAFTSGKMKWLYPYMEENSKKMVKFIEKQPDAINGRGFDAKEVATRYTLNNVAESIFGIDGKCFDEENNEFRQLARDFLSPESWSIAIFTLALALPWITKIFPVRLVPKFVVAKLTDIVTETLNYREKNNVVRKDFLHIINELRKTSKEYEFTDIDVTAHASGFFGDGYETSSMVMSAVLFQLSTNADAQSKLREEVNTAFEENGNKLPYEILQTLPYLDAVINETLRLIPPTYNLQKKCTESFTFTLEDTNKPLFIEKGTPIILPVYGLHHDAQYFENPEIFDPERFVGENKSKVRKGTFLPLGEGPRTCLGQRFGFLQIKVGISYIIRNYELSLNKKTQTPLKFDPTVVLLTPVGGVWIDFKKIDNVEN